MTKCATCGSTLQNKGLFPVRCSSRQRLALLITATSMLAMLLFPPFHVVVKGVDTNMGYRLLFSPPRWDAGTIAVVNTPLLLVQILLAGVAGFAAVLLCGSRGSTPPNTRPRPAAHTGEAAVTAVAGGSGGITISCPSCQFARQVPVEQIPARARHVTCPKCQQRFAFRSDGI